MSVSKNNNSTFENIKRIDKNRIEFWYTREFSKVLEYTE